MNEITFLIYYLFGIVVGVLPNYIAYYDNITLIIFLLSGIGLLELLGCYSMIEIICYINSFK